VPFGSTVHHPFRFARRKPIQQENLQQRNRGQGRKTGITQRRRERQRRVTDQPCHCLRPCRKRTTKNQRLLTTGITIVYFPSSQNQRRQNAIKERSRRKEHKHRKVTETVATTFNVSRTRRESNERQKGGTRRCLTSALITRSFVFVVKHTRPGNFILSHSAI